VIVGKHSSNIFHLASDVFSVKSAAVPIHFRNKPLVALVNAMLLFYFADMFESVIFFQAFRNEILYHLGHN